MSHQSRTSSCTRARRVGTPMAALIAAAALTLVPSAARAAIGTPVPLGDATSFAVLAGAGITNTGATTIGGDIGSFPTTSITGLGTITLVDGVDQSGQAVTAQAKDDLTAAYGAASAQSPDPLGGVELGGLTLEPGVYDTGGVIELNGNLTLDANGDPDAVFVFHSLETLLAGAASSITFVDGATACNLYWRVPSSATIGAGSQFAGTILADVMISFGAGATLEGRALAQGEVTMISNTITVPECAAAPPVTPPPVEETEAAEETEVPDESTETAAPVEAADRAASGPQVEVAPRGGVATGDGSSLAASASSSVPVPADQRPLLGALVLSGLGLTAWTVARSRRSRTSE